MLLEDHPAVKKAIWAARRLEEMEEAIREYSARKPYTVRPRNETRRIWELVFTEAAPPWIGFMAGDFFYNERASLDYLPATLVPKNKIRSSYFPILEKRVWEIPEAENENENLRTQRKRWSFVEQNMKPEAIKILKQLQPENSQPNAHEKIAPVTVLNRLSNSDRHRTFAFARECLTLEGTAKYVHNDGREEHLEEASAVHPLAYKDGAQIERVPATVNAIELNGNVELLFKVGNHLISTKQLQEVHKWVLMTIGLLAPLARADEP